MDNSALCLPHDHSLCIERALDAAEKICAQNGVRLTALRRRVLELVWQSHKPVTAYDLLDRLRTEKRNAAPPTVYRALDFLREQGLVHRLDSLNAFLGCNHPDRAHRGGFLICTACHAVEEIRESGQLRQAIGEEASARGFEITSSMVEILGLCAQCRQRRATS
ncbi:MAG: transcriptional repressor [Alphaproteobacteria bacterium]|nr:MAG: transcriptional repressor [Alphaproteobacteria bacterium]